LLDVRRARKDGLLDVRRARKDGLLDVRRARNVVACSTKGEQGLFMN